MNFFQNFKIKNNRPLRVLHIGNIANNAYVNAKIMRRIGIEADVMCPDAYFVHTCPEWEDLDIDPNLIEDHNYPDWSKVDLKGFKRPVWFYQGPRTICVYYFMFKNKLKIFFLNKYLSRLSTFIFVNIFKLIGTLNFVKFSNFFYTLLYFSKLLIKFLKLLFTNPILLSKKIYKIIFLKSNKNQEKPNSFKKIDEFENYVNLFSKRKSWLFLLNYYDIIQCYAEEGYWLHASNAENYVAYEHGTIRELPFKNSLQGKRCRITYINAKAVFVTNVDCLASAEKLKINENRLFPIPHAIDSERYISIRKINSKKIFKDQMPTFIAPARHHWKNDLGDLSWVKGNDIIVKSAAISKKNNIRYTIKFVEWGQEVDLTKALIEELNVQEYFHWVKLMPRKKLLDEYVQSCGVIDQFRMKAIGSITIDALALGIPVFTNIDEKSFKNFFGSIPPIMNVSDSKTLSKKINFILNNKNDVLKIKKESINWFDKYHSSSKILDIHGKAYSKVIK